VFSLRAKEKDNRAKRFAELLRGELANLAENVIAAEASGIFAVRPKATLIRRNAL
jgi:hypothetical protein